MDHPQALQAAEPIKGQARSLPWDSVRGMALYGILLMNIGSFKVPLIYEMTPYWPPFVAGSDWNALWHHGLPHFLQNRFITAFSLLFGVGLAWIYSKPEVTPRVRIILLRRLIVLALFGLAHITFLWLGDILLNYAIAGLLALLWINQRPSRLLLWGGLLFFCGQAGGYLISFYHFPYWGMHADAVYRGLMESIPVNIAVYQEGNYTAQIAFRWNEYLLMSKGFFWSGTLTTLGLILIGLSMGKWIPYQCPIPQNIPLAIAAIFLFVVSGLWFLLDREGIRFANLLSFGFLYSLPILTSSLAWMLALLFLCSRFPHFIGFRMLAATGRMPLTNYLGQSFLLAFIFYSWGLGYFGSITAWQGSLIATLLFLVFMTLSFWWIRYLPIGPLEWLWRKASYPGGKSQKAESGLS